MWSKIKTFCLHSLTIAWSYLLAIIGGVLQIIDSIADILGDPGLKDQITAVVGDARTVGRILLAVSVVTIVARVRTACRRA